MQAFAYPLGTLKIWPVSGERLVAFPLNIKFGGRVTNGFMTIEIFTRKCNNKLPRLFSRFMGRSVESGYKYL